MFDFVPYLSFLTSGIGVLFICYLLVRFPRIPQVYMLGWIIFSLVFLEFYIYALTSKHIYQMLFILRTPNIIRIFLPVVLYWYVRQMLLPSMNAKVMHYWHFVFPVLLTIGVMPDLFLSAVEKTAILDHYYAQNKYFISTPMGWLPSGFVQPASILFGIVYGVITLFLIWQTKHKMGTSYVHINKQSLIWLNLLSGAITIYFLLQLYQYINLFLNNSFDPPSQLIKCAIGISLFTYFITTPNVQENMDGCILPKEKGTPTIPEIQPDLILAVASDMEAIAFDKKMKTDQAYLSPDFDLAVMAKLVDMPPAKLSKQIKMYYGISFAEYINRLRIHHFLQQRSSFDQYTLETYMYQSGFTNRSTFYVAFKKYVGVNPSFYLKEISQSS
ncbi:helix-turn-helix domain-containing protein [Aquirufa lenticrescens]|uniref:helix-turn-helix domain-containing protein n=1 Tax=Aquirufa lenticrescens TaxID=2696560 RepID=UPI001CAA7D2A|nr:helix-turn-helix domain-containing protein [Aquirufa lenticrescens]UAJ13581.1 AraC family transcriptional regulator [Aquirufa lenticrescens]